MPAGTDQAINQGPQAQWRSPHSQGARVPGKQLGPALNLRARLTHARMPFSISIHHWLMRLQCKLNCKFMNLRPLGARNREQISTGKTG